LRRVIQAMEMKESIRHSVDLIVFDFDGVLTDNRVIVLEDGREGVVCNRADGLGFDMLRAAEIPTMIMSTERNTVVARRAEKLQIPVLQSVRNKKQALFDHCGEAGIDPNRIIFVGNDLNDLAVMKSVGFAIAVADAHPEVQDVAWTVLKTSGGDGVARELAESVLGLDYLALFP
jgi:YrbI family 3-deoxy-D-manno-octulosonate 8-phosphate phosphatase